MTATWSALKTFASRTSAAPRQGALAIAQPCWAAEQVRLLWMFDRLLHLPACKTCLGLAEAAWIPAEEWPTALHCLAQPHNKV